MKYIFLGTPEFAAIILEKLIKAGFIPEAVVCNLDKPVGRKKIITAPPVKLLIERLKDCKIKVLQPENLTSYILNLKSLNPDLFIVAAYAKIIPKEILEIPRLGTIGVHPSLLPKYRGPSPIQTAILNGDEGTGVSLYLMDEGLDSGPILAQRELNYELRIMNYELLMRKLAELGADLLIDFLRKLNQFLEVQPPPELNSSIFGRLNLLQPQDKSQATYTKKFSAKGGSATGGKTEDGYIEPKDLEKARQEGGEIAAKIERKIRALNPEPGVWTYAKALTNNHMQIDENKRVKLLGAELIENKLKLKKIQFEGKKPREL